MESAGRSKKLRVRLTFFWLGSLAAAFCYGVGVGRYDWPPLNYVYRNYRFLQQSFRKETFESGEAELLHFAFTDQLVDTELIHPEMHFIEDIREANQRIFVPVADFDNAYNNIVILDAQNETLDEGATRYVRIRFRYAGKVHQAFAYGGLPSVSNRGTAAMLIIPGSGNNQSSAIHFGDPDNYHHGILDVSAAVGADVYTFVKPNEDFLAWHDGSHKINANFIVAYHLNRGGSYSASYIIRSMAVVKHLQSRYDTCIVAGLSQGGAAALLNAIQSRPTAAIIASGFSLLRKSITWAGYNQILGVPTLGLLSNPDFFNDVVSGLDTRFMFTWGKNEIGIYRMESESAVTAEMLESVDNAESVIHDDGHVFPVAFIEDFIVRVLDD